MKKNSISMGDTDYMDLSITTLLAQPNRVILSVKR